MAKWKQPKKFAVLSPLLTRTGVWRVENKATQEIIGFIKWCKAWRKYAFFPSYNTIFEQTCLQDITDFLKELKDKHKNGRKEIL